VASAFLISVKPVFLERILACTKHYELRRSNVRFNQGDLVILYGSSPLKTVVGAFTVACVHRGTPIELWTSRGEGFGVSRQEYNEYFGNSMGASAIEIRDRVRVPPVTLEVLRRLIPGFRPPQSYSQWLTDPSVLIGRKAVDTLGWKRNG